VGTSANVLGAAVAKILVESRELFLAVGEQVKQTNLACSDARHAGTVLGPNWNHLAFMLRINILTRLDVFGKAFARLWRASTIQAARYGKGSIRPDTIRWAEIFPECSQAPRKTLSEARWKDIPLLASEKTLFSSNQNPDRAGTSEETCFFRRERPEGISHHRRGVKDGVRDWPIGVPWRWRCGPSGWSVRLAHPFSSSLLQLFSSHKYSAASSPRSLVLSLEPISRF
jgi:hypothetical protein